MGLFIDNLSAFVDNHDIRVRFKPAINSVNPIDYLVGINEIELKINDTVKDTRRVSIGDYELKGYVEKKGTSQKVKITVQVSVRLFRDTTYKLYVDGVKHPLYFD